MRLKTSKEISEKRSGILPKEKIVELTQTEFDNLLEYSCSLPTGVVMGKRWKRAINSFNGDDGWLLGEYLQSPTDETKYIIRFSKIKLEKVK